jgi:hypothetical protein
MVKRFVLGFLVGVGLMYYYLHNGEDVWGGMARWFGGTASSFRGDSEHRAAHDILNDAAKGR